MKVKKAKDINQVVREFWDKYSVHEFVVSVGAGLSKDSSNIVVFVGEGSKDLPETFEGYQVLFLPNTDLKKYLNRL